METSIWVDGMFGLAVGDALGVPVEFRTREQIKNSMEGPVTGMRGHGTHDMPAGTWSDDTSMALATLEALERDREINPEHIMNLFCDWQDLGAYSPFNEVFDEGNTCRKAIENFKRDRDTRTCGVTGEYANGNGALMRILPACIFVYESVKNEKMTEEESVWRVHEIASLTHNHLRSNMCCGTYYFLVKAILDRRSQQNGTLLDILQAGMDEANAFYGKKAENAEEMKRLGRIRKLCEFRDTPEEKIKSSGYVIDTMEASLWCLLRTDSYHDAVLMAVNLGDDTDTTAAVTGGLAGLYYGYSNIPAEWTESICSAEKILIPSETMAGTVFRFGLSVEPYREELLRRLKIKHRWVTPELMNSIYRLEIEEVGGEMCFVTYRESFGITIREVSRHRNTGVELEVLAADIARELIRRNPVVAAYSPKHSGVEDSGGWRLERYEIRRHETGDYSLFQQYGDRCGGGSKEDMINPLAFSEPSFEGFLEWVPSCGIDRQELLKDEGYKAFVGYDKESQNSIRIRFTRDSVSMGDDCTAPHEEEMLFKASDTWLDLLKAAARYVPAMYDYEWEVMCDAEVIGTLTSGSEAEYRAEVKQADALVSSLAACEIFCRKKKKIENLTYFERLEVLYAGEYFSADCFNEYGNAGMILEEEETKITTSDKAFALKHGFEHRELGNYDKILPIDQFEGMRILRIPSDPHAKMIRINIPKEKIMEELKKRVKSPHDMITDGVLAYGVDVGRFVYEEEGYTVYVISDFPHIGPSDVFMVYQISKADYEKLLLMSCPDGIPRPPVPSEVTNACRKKFLCGESAYCERYYCTLDDVDKAFAERIVGLQASSKQQQSKSMNYCPNCGEKNGGYNYCIECGTKLSST